jgi:hypothetical protein
VFVWRAICYVRTVVRDKQREAAVRSGQLAHRTNTPQHTVQMTPPQSMNSSHSTGETIPQVHSMSSLNSTRTSTLELVSAKDTPLSTSPQSNNLSRALASPPALPMHCTPAQSRNPGQNSDSPAIVSHPHVHVQSIADVSSV